MTHRLIYTFLGVIGLFLAGCSKYEEPVWRTTPNVPGPAGSGNGSTTRPDSLAQPAPAPKPSYIDNGVVRLAVDLNRGGAITYLTATSNGKNMVNAYDLGRMIQPSFYAGPVPFKPNGKEPYYLWANLGWNPLQTGDAYGNTSQVIAFQNYGDQLYIKTRPMIWPLPAEPAECTFETWIQLDNNTVKIRHRLNNGRSDQTQYSATAQELPAISVTAGYHNAYAYTGEQPFTNGALTQIKYQRSESVTDTKGLICPENWIAMVNDANWGLGVWKPNHYYFLTNKNGPDVEGDETSFSCSYLSPSTYEILDHNIQYDYEYTLILGTVDQIRQFVYAQSRPTAGPDYRFTADRQHWWYYQGSDTGWPINNELNLPLDKGNFLMVGPPVQWQAANTAKIYVKAAFNTDAKYARLRWKRPGDPELLNDRILDFPIINDGAYHTYTLDMTQVPSWSGTIVELAMEPAVDEKGGPGKFAKIQSISMNP